jgi:hypothetical protein
MARPSAPDCDEKATFPCGGQVVAKVALSATAGSALTSPRQLGPTMRMPVAAHLLDEPVLQRLALGPARLGEARGDDHQGAHALAMQSSATSSTCAAGTTITARSTGSGMASTDGYAFTDCTTAAPGFTGYTAP